MLLLLMTQCQVCKQAGLVWLVEANLADISHKALKARQAGQHTQHLVHSHRKAQRVWDLKGNTDILHAPQQAGPASMQIVQNQEADQANAKWYLRCV